MAIKARRCLVPLSPSDWVAKVFLTCDNRLAVQFKHGEHVKKVLPHGPGAYWGQGGVPGVCCLYPGTQGELAVLLHELAQVWTYAGEWVHAFLYKKFPYTLANPPASCGNCNTAVAVSASNNAPSAGDVVTFTATVTNTDGDASHGAAPTGSVAFKVDGTSIGIVSLPAVDSWSTNAVSVTQDWTATSGTHTIQAVYTPANSEFASASGSMSLTVGGGITTSCCPSNPIPATLHLTISSVSGCGCLAGTYVLTWDATASQWEGSLGNACGVQGGSHDLALLCNGTNWGLTMNAAGASCSLSATAMPTSVNCSTPQWVFQNVVVNGNCCSGTVNITITA